MGEHRDEVGTRLGVDPFVPQIGEEAEALAEDFLALLFALDNAARVRNGCAAIRPVTQLAPVLEWKVEQRRQHLDSQLDRDPVDPVECFVARQTVEHVADATADQALKIGEIARRDDRLNHLALVLMLGRVHRDEHGKLHVRRPVPERDPVGRREQPVLHFGVDDVLVFGHRPEGSERAVLAEVHGGVPAQAAEIVLPNVLLVQPGIADVDLVERNLFR